MHVLIGISAIALRDCAQSCRTCRVTDSLPGCCSITDVCEVSGTGTSSMRDMHVTTSILTINLSALETRCQIHVLVVEPRCVYSVSVFGLYFVLEIELTELAVCLQVSCL